MILESLFGGALGGLLRLAPEVLKWLDRRGERSHELAMQELTLRSLQVQGEFAMREAEIQRAQSFDAGALQALSEAVRAQAQPSGVRWVDAFSQLVRPGVTFCLFGLYALARVAAFFVAIQQGQPVLVTLSAVWNEADAAMLASCLNFWFLGRVFDKVGRGL